MEYLLLHAFHAKKFIVPDKIPARNKEPNSAKRKMNTDADVADVDELNVNDISLDNDAQHLDQGKGKKGPSYSGGLVLEPKKGLYDKYILLLDFNSLYPSIIQVLELSNVRVLIALRFADFLSVLLMINNWHALYSSAASLCFSFNRSTIFASLQLNDLMMALFLVYHLQKLLEFYLRYLSNSLVVRWRINL